MPVDLSSFGVPAEQPQDLSAFGTPAGNDLSRFGVPDPAAQVEPRPGSTSTQPFQSAPGQRFDIAGQAAVLNDPATAQANAQVVRAPILQLPVPTKQQVQDAFAVLGAAGIAEKDPRLARQLMESPSEPPGTAAKIVAGATGALANTASGMTTLENLTMMPLTGPGVPSLVRRGAHLYFTYLGAEGAAAGVDQLAEGVGSRDPEKIAEGAVNTAAGLGIAGMSAKGAVMGNPISARSEPATRDLTQSNVIPDSGRPIVDPIATRQAEIRATEQAQAPTSLPAREARVAPDIAESGLREVVQPDAEVNWLDGLERQPAPVKPEPRPAVVEGFSTIEARKSEPVLEPSKPETVPSQSPIEAYLVTPEAMSRARSIAARYAEQLGESADYLAQDAIGKVWERIARNTPEGVDPAKVENWASTAFKNHYLDLLKNKDGQRLRGAERFGEVEEGGIALEQKLADKGVTPDNQAAFEDFRSMLERKTLPKLDKVSQDMLRSMLVEEKLTFQELGDRHGMTHQAAQQRWRKAIRTIVDDIREADLPGEQWAEIMQRFAENDRKGGGAKLYGGIPFFDPSLYKPLVEFGGAVLGKTGRKFSEWSRAMVSFFGNRVMPYLRNVYERLTGQHVKAEEGMPAAGPRNPSWTEALKGNMGAEDVLKVAGEQKLAGQTRVSEDFTNKLLADGTAGYGRWKRKYTSQQQKVAAEEAQRYLAIRERRVNDSFERVDRDAQARGYFQEMSPAGRELVKSIEDAAVLSGKTATDLDLHVKDGNQWRPMRDLKEKHFPRVLKEEVQEILRDPDAPKNRKAYDGLLRDMVRNKNAKDLTEADSRLRSTGKATTGSDYFANAEKARGERLPDHFYDTDPIKYFEEFWPRFAKRAGNVKAFGQAKGEGIAPAFEEAMGRTRDTNLQGYLRELHDVYHNVRQKDRAADAFVEATNKVTTGVFLSGVRTFIRNSLGSYRSGAEKLGFLNASYGHLQSYASGAVASAKTVARALKRDFRIETPEKVLIAEELGAVRRDMRAAAAMDLTFESGKRLDKAVTAATFINNAVDRLGRTGNMIAAMGWLRDTARIAGHAERTAGKKGMAAWVADYHLRTRLAALKRWGYEGQKAADLIQGKPEVVERFLRDMVQETDYGYTASQTPLFLHKPWGMTFFRFQKYGFQRHRDLMRNVIAPANFFKPEKVNGKSTINVGPLLRYITLAVGGAEAMRQLFGFAFGESGKDASLDEIRITGGEDEQRALLLLSERLFHDMVMEGGIGILGDYAGLAEEFATRGRFKNPMEPPGFSVIRSIGGFIESRVDRGMTADGLGRDLEKAADIAPAIRDVKRLGVRIAGAAGDESEFTQDRVNVQQVRWLKGAVRRFAEERGLDRRVSSGGGRKNENTEAYDSLAEALLRGDASAARKVVRAFAGEPGMDGYRDNVQKLRSSIANRHPLFTMGVSNREEMQDFLSWAQKRLPDDVGQIKRLVRNYERTAREVGLKDSVLVD